MAGTAQAACGAAAWSFDWGVPSTLYLMIDGGSACGTRVPAGGTSAITAYKITSRPRNGSAVAGNHIVGYRPKPGFKGDDSFDLVIQGRRNDRPVQAPVRVQVRVQ